MHFTSQAHTKMRQVRYMNKSRLFFICILVILFLCISSSLELTLTPDVSVYIILHLPLRGQRLDEMPDEKMPSENKRKKQGARA